MPGELLRSIDTLGDAFEWVRFSSGDDVYFETEGCLTDHDYYNGRYWDLRMISITRDRWADVCETWDPVFR